MKRALFAGLAAAACGACGHKAPPPAPPPAHPPSTKQQIEGPDTGEEPAKPDQDDARIAAIQAAMNALAPVANQCWAAAAAGDFHVAGAVKMMITFDGDGRATAKADEDTTKSAVLTDCLSRVLVAYAWPAGLMAGQAIELPFQFTAPTGQNTIDRRLVPKSDLTGAQLQVLLDEKNSGNPAAAMYEVDLDPGATLPLSLIARDEVWIFLDPARLAGPRGKPTEVAALDVAYLKKLSYASVSAPDGAAARVVIVAMPGGEVARDRLPNPTLTPRPDPMPRNHELVDLNTRLPPPAGARGPELHPRAKAKRYPHAGGAVTILVENAPHAASADVIEIDAGAKVPTHVHEHETELLYVMSGSGTLTVDGVDMPVGPSTVVQLPANVPHSFAAADAVTAIQLYTPPGPEQRFKKMK